ncbi:ABC-type ATPase [Pelotomaculum thermopropionicum SI]|uniref:ABC-type ATPase n=1 Tax=Pelotomaculum thermopropionicum (strain DSM 13744 / JCM 10971 / SI) TaxID=370438 RepID=A5D073_PELTS|nr:ABC-type ATPase [Pelotomaculum thermopropionicum SI]
MEFTVNRHYAMQTITTPRTLAIAEAFGVSLDDQYTFTVFDNFTLTVAPGDIIYITGDSGSGKSTLLRELHAAHPNVLAAHEITVDPEAPIIESVGHNTPQAVQLLTIVGLNDAFLFLRKYRELSDGQKYRFMLAKMLEADVEAFFIDEFCSILDRDTAKIVAFNMQKVCRKNGKTLVVATAHTDLEADLSPDVVIRKGLGSNVQTLYPWHPPLPHRCTVEAEITLEPGTLRDYKALSRFHYRNDKMFRSAQHVFKYTHRGQTVGVIVYQNPPLALAGRNAWTDRYRAATSEVARLLNQEVTMITRVVLHPKYRGIGLGARLIRDTMPLTGKRYVEMLTTMGTVNPFAEKAGMTRVPYTPFEKFKKLRAQLRLLGWDFTFGSSVAYNLEKLNTLDPDTYRLLATDIIKQVYNAKDGGTMSVNKGHKQAWRRKVDEFSKEEVAKLIKDVMPRERAYYIWENPEYKTMALTS